MTTNPKKSKCCDKCRNGAGKYRLAIAREYCLNSSCTCHKKLVIATRAKGKPMKVSVYPKPAEAEQWEIEFDKNFVRDGDYEYPFFENTGYLVKNIKDFFRNQLAQARKVCVAQRDEELREIISTKLKK